MKEFRAKLEPFFPLPVVCLKLTKARIGILRKKDKCKSKNFTVFLILFLKEEREVGSSKEVVMRLEMDGLSLAKKDS